MKIFRALFVFMVLMANLKNTKAQSAATFDAAQVFSRFKFVDSKGVVDNSFSTSIVSAKNLGYLSVAEKGLMWGLNVGLREAGSSKDIDAFNFTWNYQYAEIKAAVGYMPNKWRIRPFVSLSPYFAYLLTATQTINEKKYDIKKENAIASSDYGLFFNGGVKVKLSDFISIYSAYNQIYGLKNLETNSNTQSYNRGFSINLGVALTITKLTPNWIK